MKKVLIGLLIIVILLAGTVTMLETFSSYTPSASIHQDAPVKIRQTININAPVEKVWGVFTDINNWKLWQMEISSSTINGPFQPGTSFDWKSAGLFIHSTLYTVEPFKTVIWSGKAFGSFAIHDWSFSEQDGYTTVNVEESMEGWLVSLMKKYFQTRLDPATRDWLTYLKVQCESVH